MVGAFRDRRVFSEPLLTSHIHNAREASNTLKDRTLISRMTGPDDSWLQDNLAGQ